MVETMKKAFYRSNESADILDAWRSHDTLFRQSNGNFDEIIKELVHFTKARLLSSTLLHTHLVFTAKSKITVKAMHKEDGQVIWITGLSGSVKLH